MNRLADTLPKLWPSFELPGVRPHPAHFTTYSRFTFEDLPPVKADADDQFSWLKNEPEKEEDSLLADGRGLEEGLQSIVAASDVALPLSLVTFLRSPQLQSRVRSCTACYLELPEYLVPVARMESGYLLHFLSDQQWCLHWSLCFDQTGGEFVICSETAYGFEFEEDQPFTKSNPLDLVKEGVIVCAPSFTEFMYRFWIENEIWFGSNDSLPLTAKQQAYIQEYKSKPT